MNAVPLPLSLARTHARSDPGEAARRCAWLFTAAGALALVNLYALGRGRALAPDERLLATALALADLLAAGIIATLPWSRWRAEATVSIVPVALALAAAFAAAGFSRPAVHGAFLVLVFVWLGVYHPPGWAAVFALPAAAAYALPLAAAGAPPDDVAAVAVVVPVCALVATTVAGAVARQRGAQRRAERRAHVLRVVARATRRITRLDAAAVADEVVMAVRDLGFTVAVVAAVQDGGPRTVGAGGVDVTAADALLADRVPPAVLRGERDGAELDGGGIAVGVDSSAGVRLVVMAAADPPIAVAAEEREALELLAAQAAEALSSARAFERERRERRRHADAAVSDPLTGLGNRRAADAAVAALLPGDAVVLLDLDHFKRVNDRDGHAAGDAVLREVGAHLRSTVRSPDVAARLGGEEFLVILKAAGGRAETAARRLLEGWRALDPVTTMSAGVAVHERGRPPEAALAEADAALYRAKASGRDRVATADLSPGARPAR